MKQGRTRRGATIATEWYRIVNERIPGGVRELDHSFADKQAVRIVLAVVQIYL